MIFVSYSWLLMSWNGRLSRSFIYLPLILTRQLDLWHCHMGTSYTGRLWCMLTSHPLPFNPHFFAQFGAFNWYTACGTIRIRYTSMTYAAPVLPGTDRLITAPEGFDKTQGICRNAYVSVIIHMESTYIINIWKAVGAWHGARRSNELLTWLRQCGNIVIVREFTTGCSVRQGLAGCCCCGRGVR